MMRKILIIINTQGGQTESKRTEYYLRKKMDETEIPYTLFVSDSIDKILSVVDEELKKQISDIMVMGGDGTISLIANKIIHTDIVLMILPGGTGNQLAKYFKIPNSLARALHVSLWSKKVVKIDTLAIGDRHSILNISMGLSSLTMVSVGVQLKKALGNVGYIGALLEILLRYPSFRFHVKTDGTERVLKGRELLIMNTSFKQMPLTPILKKSNPFDGKVECYIFQIRGVFSFIAFIADTISRIPRRKNRYLVEFDFRESIEIDKIEDIPFQVDGDEVPFNGITAKIEEKSLKVRVPE